MSQFPRRPTPSQTHGLPPFEHLATYAQVADLTGYSVSTVKDWCYAGKLTRHPTPSGGVRIDLRELAGAYAG
jgi:hypothetical protein